MRQDIRAARTRIVQLLDRTRAETRRQLSTLEPELVVHQDERRWRVRDVLGHLAVWNWEAARSLRAYCEGGQYHCIAAESQYDEYNGPAAEERRKWPLEQVWSEYEAAHDELRRIIEQMPDEKWDGPMLYPWNLQGTPGRLIEIMMTHERTDHCDAIAETGG